MIGSHNSYTFLPAKCKILNWFSFLWRCQVKNIYEQKGSKVSYFDIRVRRDMSTWRICHGIVDFNLTFNSLEEIVNIFSDKYVRLILERGDAVLFKEEIARLEDKYPSLVFSCIKKNWEILVNRDLSIIDYTYTPWLSGLSFWENIKRFNFFSTIKRWAKKHNPIMNDIVIKDSKVHFMDYV